MRQRTLIRIGLASVALVGSATAVLASGCSSDDNVVAVTDAGKDTTTGQDTGTDTGNGNDTGTGNDAGDTGTGGDAEAGPPACVAPGPYDAGPNGNWARILVAHASPDVPSIRFCFGTGAAASGSDTVVGPIPTLPHSSLPGQQMPGLDPGTGGALPEITDLQPAAITGFVILASHVAWNNADAGNSDGGAEEKCDKLIGGDGKGGILKPGVDYFQLKTIPAGTFAHDTTTLVVATGCFPASADPKANAFQCGSDWTAATGNIGAMLFKLDRTIADPTKMGAQVIHVASAIDGYAGIANPPGVTNIVGLAGPTGTPLGAPITPPPAGITFGKEVPTTAAPQPAGAEAKTNLIYVQTVAPDGGAVGTFALPLDIVAKLTNGVGGTSANGCNYFAPGENYTFVLMGDPTAAQLVNDAGAPNPAYDGHGVHIIAFPNNVHPPRFQ